MKHHKLIVASVIFFLVSLLSIKVSAGPYTNIMFQSDLDSFSS